MDIVHTIEWCKIDHGYFYSILFLATNDGAKKLVEQFEGKSIDDGAGNGRAAWEAPINKYKKKIEHRPSGQLRSTA